MPRMAAYGRSGSALIDVLVALTVLGVGSASVIPLLLSLQRLAHRTVAVRNATTLVHHVRGLVTSSPCAASSGTAYQGGSEITWSIARDGVRLSGDAFVASSDGRGHGVAAFQVPLAAVCAE
jgi:hypothetical protein